MGVPLPLGVTVSSVLEPGADIYVTVRVIVDKKKHVAPIASTPAPVRPAAPANPPPMVSKTAKVTGAAAMAPAEQLRYRTITKYSYFESGEKWVKVLLPELAGLKNHPAEKIKVEFANRSFSVIVLDFNNQNW